jgi:hypothetical protein
MKFLTFLWLLTGFLQLFGQQDEPRTTSPYDPPACLSARDDQQLMMDKLGITTMRPGKSPDASSPNPANYDEALANPFPELPDLLITENGKKVKSPEMWWEQRRPEIAEQLEREVYGRIPEDVPEVNWEVVVSERELIGWTPVVAKKVVGHVDHSRYPLIDVDISMVVVTPARAEGPVPVLMMFGPAYLPAPAQPSRDDFEVLNQAVKALLARDPAIREILDKYPAYDPLVRPEGYSPWGFRMPSPGDPSPTQHRSFLHPGR